jgi:putative N6-adenine-specific DNA methylase
VTRAVRAAARGLLGDNPGMEALDLFLPCAAGVETWLADEVRRIAGVADVRPHRAGVGLRAAWREVMRLNLHSRLAQRVLVQLWSGPYRCEDDLYAAARALAWEDWFTPGHTIKVEVTAQRSPLRSLNFAALRIKDAVCDRFRERSGQRPSVDTARPDVRLYAHLRADVLSLSIDTSGEPLFKRGWREDKGDAPLKETLAAAMIAATGWGEAAAVLPLEEIPPLYDPCCGSGTVVIEAAQVALRIAPGLQRRFAFEKLLPLRPDEWRAQREEALQQRRAWPAGHEPIVFGSDVAFRMVDFARRNAERAGVAPAVSLRGGDALERRPPCTRPGVMLLNPPYGERIAAAGVAGRNAKARAAERPGRQNARLSDGRTDSEGSDFFARLAAHWKGHYGGWTAWLLSPDTDLPSKMRLKPSRRVPLWNGPIECRLFRFDLTARREQGPAGADGA